MKTIFTIILVLLIGVSVFTPNTNIHTAPETSYASVAIVPVGEREVYFEDEEYIDDIPFDTKAIADNTTK
jgi:hypothetical protein